MDVKTLCLGILSQGDTTGYEIKKQFESHYSHFYEASFGSIYPALAKLTKNGLVSCTQKAQEKRPDKKVYSITSAGRLAFLDELNKVPGRDHIRSEFLATMLFGDLLSPAQLDKVIENKLSEYRAELEQMETSDMSGASAGHTFVHGFGISFYRAAISYIEEHGHTVVGGALLSRPSATASASNAQHEPAPLGAREAAE